MSLTRDHTLHVRATIKSINPIRQKNAKGVPHISPPLPNHGRRAQFEGSGCHSLVKAATSYKTLSTTFTDQLLHFASLGNYVNVRRHRKWLSIKHCDSTSGVAVSHHEGLMYSVSWDWSFKMWNTRDCIRCSESLKAQEDAINAIVTSDTGTIHTGFTDGLIRV
ncbi:hypothetical protein CRG98_008665 [Punica granatum]|uniref:Uncharacterized protein n=1 Tax=Punica granatum TaxID=22663 RepID=A0A2I0KR22_PUNGR|nr:hypothetical protein CRG98_008665 [Punica granatum]